MSSLRTDVVLIAIVSGCGDPAATPPDAPAIPDAGFQPAPHLSLGKIPFQGGRTLDHVKLVTVTFPNYAYRSEIQAFGDWMVASQWVITVGGEYGIGHGSHVAKVVSPSPPAAIVTLPDIETFLHDGMMSGVLPTPASTAEQYMFLIYYPASTRVDAPGFTGCQTGGFHTSLVHGAAKIAYAPIPDCSTGNPFGWTAVESIEENASHEFIEALTDPDFDAPGWLRSDPNDPWSA